MFAAVKMFFKTKIVIVSILVLIIPMFIVFPDFFSLSSMIGLLVQISIYGVLACAMTIAIICGEFDLSVSATFPLGTLIFAIMMPIVGIVPALIIAVIIGALIGCVNGFFVAILKINAFIVTLSTMIIINGIALTICGGKPISAINDTTYEIGNGSFLGVLPYLIIIFLVFVLFTEFVLKKTRFGRNIYAVGGNYEVASYAGINVRYFKFIIFVILGCTAAFAGSLLTCRLQAGSPIYGDDIALTVISAAVIGGNSLAGGKGGALKTLLGMIFIGLLLQVFSYINVYVYLQEAVKGIVVILVVLMDAINNKKDALAAK